MPRECSSVRLNQDILYLLLILRYISFQSFLLHAYFMYPIDLIHYIQWWVLDFFIQHYLMIIFLHSSFSYFSIWLYHNLFDPDNYFGKTNLKCIHYIQWDRFLTWKDCCRKSNQNKIIHFSPKDFFPFN